MLRWTGLTVPANGSVTIDIDAVAPTSAAPGDTYTNRAGVRSYQGTNNGGTPTDYFPTNNVDPAVTPNTDRADDSVDVTVAGGGITKSASSLAEGGNSSGGQATIGEVVTFTVTGTVPRGTTMYGSPAITDTVNARYGLIAGSATYTVDTGAGAGAASPATVNGALISVPLGPIDGGAADTYVNPAGSGDDVITLSYQARVLDVAGNTRTQTAIPNTYKELIGLAVSGATRCRYCAYFHAEAARMFGATEDEIVETAMIAKNTMGWSTYLNTLQFDYDEFVREFDQVVEHAKAAAAAPA